MFGEPLPEMEQLVCWECLALLRRFIKFKHQVHSAQEHLRVLAISHTQESMDHTYMSQSLSCLETSAKTDYDKIFFDYTAFEQTEWSQCTVAVSSESRESVKDEQYDVAQAVRDNINLDMDAHILEEITVPEIVLQNSVAGMMPHIVVGADMLVHADGALAHAHSVKGELPELTVRSTSPSKLEAVFVRSKPAKQENEMKAGYVTEYMSETEMLASREAAKQRVQYACCVYKCELCIIGFYTQQQVEEHFVGAHRADDFKTQALPLARIKKIMKLDDEVKMISAEAPVLFAKAAEIFIHELTLRAWSHTEDNKRRTLQRNDIAMAISKSDQFDFLIDIVPRHEVKPAKPREDPPRPTPASDQVCVQLAQQEAVVQPCSQIVQQTSNAQPASSNVVQPQPQPVTLLHQIINSNGEMQQLPIQLTQSQLNMIRLQVQNNPSQPIIIQAQAQPQQSPQIIQVSSQAQHQPQQQVYLAQVAASQDDS